ncbi:MAG: WD40 repeat domain-containing protein [Bacteroidales bacterium]|nr:WD40 repeat domain-containing protein [Bacteroidales bacterium]
MNRTEQKTVLEAFRKVLGQELHNLRERPEILWQQMYNRLQWVDREGGNGLISGIIKSVVEYRSKPGSEPWFKLKNALAESESVILATIKEHGNPINSCSFSPDNRLILSAGDDKTVKIWNVKTLTEIKTLKAHDEGVNCCSYSPDGKLIVSGGQDNNLIIWDSLTYKELARLEGHSDIVNALAFSPDGKTIISGSNDGEIKFWDSITFQECWTITSGYRPITSCSYSPDGRIIVTTNDDGEIALVDADSYEELSYERLKGSLSCCALNSNGVDIVTGGDSGKGYHLPEIFYITENDELDSEGDFEDVPRGETHSKEITACAYSPDGSVIITGGADNFLLLWDADNFEFLSKLIGHNDKISKCIYSPDGKSIASSSVDGTIKIWDAARARVETVYEDDFLSDRITCCAFNLDDSKVMAGSLDSNLIIYDAHTGDFVHHNKQIESPITYCGFSPDRKDIVIGTTMGEIILLKQGNYNKLVRLTPWRTTIYEDEAAINYISFSPNGEKIVSVSGKDSGAGEGNVILCDLKNNNHIEVIEKDAAWSSCKYSPDGNRMIFIGDGITMWDMEAREKIYRINVESIDCVFSPDGESLASDYNYGTIKLWDAQTGKERLTLTGHTDSLYSVCFSPDAKTIASASSDNTLRLWDVETGKEKKVFQGVEGGKWFSAFEPDGKAKISFIKDNILTLWDANSREPVNSFPCLGNITAISVSTAGKFYALGDSGGNVYILEIMGLGTEAVKQKIPHTTPPERRREEPPVIRKVEDDELKKLKRDSYPISKPVPIREVKTKKQKVSSKAKRISVPLTKIFVILITVLISCGGYILARLSPWFWLLTGPLLLIAIVILWSTVKTKWYVCPGCGVLIDSQQKNSKSGLYQCSRCKRSYTLEQLIK